MPKSKRYMIVRGDSEDVYLIPANKIIDWLSWMENGDPSRIPDYAKALEFVEQVTFTNPEIET